MAKELLKRYGREYYVGGPRQGWKQGYNEKALGLPHTRLHRLIHRFFPGHRSMLILGCALGLQVKRAQMCGDPVVGVDWTPALGKNKLARDLVRASVTHLPFRDGSFSLGVNVNVMEHVPEDQVDHVLREQRRVCLEHFFSIPCLTDFRQLGSFFHESGHVTFKTVEWWTHALRRLGHVQHFHEKNPYGWRLFIIKLLKEDRP